VVEGEREPLLDEPIPDGVQLDGGHGGDPVEERRIRVRHRVAGGLVSNPCDEHRVLRFGAQSLQVRLIRHGR